MIPRTLQPHLLASSVLIPIITVTGPRQSGKTTLCRQTFPDKPYVNLERPDVRQFATEDPLRFLNTYRGGAILDEIQRAPELSSYLQVEVDDDPRPGRFILTGSQQFQVMTTVTQSLAGRTALFRLLPLSLEELDKGSGDVNQLMYRGFYPRLHQHPLNPTSALGDYVETYVQRDIRQLTQVRNLSLFTRFLRLCAGRIGQPLNMQSLGNDLGVSHTTVRHWLTLLEASYIVFLLPSWHANISKRQIKRPKLYFYDVGLACFLLSIQRVSHVDPHPLRGALFENLVMMEFLKHRLHRGLRSNLYFWRDPKGHEVDLIIDQGPYVTPVEIKSSQTIHGSFFKGLSTFSRRVKQHQVIHPTLVYAGADAQSRSPATVCPLAKLSERMATINAS